MQEQKFDGAAALALIKTEQVARKKTPLLTGSKLSQYRGEIFELRKAGASFGQIAYWLASQQSCPTSKTTVMRFIQNDQKNP